MNNITFSIIVPIYNTEKYLSKCIESLINQTFKNIEIILVNDGSTDSSLDICLNYEKIDSRISVINKKNEGPSESRNVGIMQASGKYILFNDSDDYIDEKSCEVFNEILINEPNIDIIAARNEEIINNVSFITPLNCSDKLTSGAVFFKNQLKLRYYSCIVMKNIYKRDFLINNNLFFRKGMLAEDVEWMPRCLLKAEYVKTVDYAFYKKNICEGSITQRIDRTKTIEDCLVILKDLESLFCEVEDTELRLLLMNYLINSFLYVFSLKKFYHKPQFNNLFDTNFLNNKALTKYNKIRVCLFRFSKNIYLLINYIWKGLK